MPTQSHPATTRPTQFPALAQPINAQLTETRAPAGLASLTQTRLIAAPLENVWDAWTDPLQLGQWWGPQGFSITTQLYEFRAGGHWVFVMHGPDPAPKAATLGAQRDFANHIIFDKIECAAGDSNQPRTWRLEYHHVSADDAEPMHFQSIVTLEETRQSDQAATRVSMSADFGTAQARDHLIAHYGAAQGGRETLARLAHYTEGASYAQTNAALGHRLILVRQLPVSSALLWRCWTEPTLIQQWFCPQPWQVTEVDNNLRAGGRSNNVMEGPGPDGQPMRNANTGSYLEVIPGQKIVFTDLLLEDWAPNPHKFLGFTASVSFEDLGNGQTRYSAVCKHGDQASQRQHAQMGFHEGWGVATDQLLALAKTLATQTS